MKEKLFYLSQKLSKLKDNYIIKNQYESHNSSTSSLLSSLNVIKSFPTESKNFESQCHQKTPSLTSLLIPKNFLLNLNRIRRNPRCSYMNKLISKNLLI